LGLCIFFFIFSRKILTLSLVFLCLTKFAFQY